MLGCICDFVLFSNRISVFCNQCISRMRRRFTVGMQFMLGCNVIDLIARYHRHSSEHSCCSTDLDNAWNLWNIFLCSHIFYWWFLFFIFGSLFELIFLHNDLYIFIEHILFLKKLYVFLHCLILSDGKSTIMWQKVKVESENVKIKVNGDGIWI